MMSTSFDPDRVAPRLPLHSCEDLLAKVRWDHEQLKQGWDAYRSFNFIITANHLYKDWLNRVGTPRQRRRKQNLPTQAKRVFKMLGDLANASKHWDLDAKNQANQVVTAVSTPQIADWYAYFVAGPVIYVEMDGARSSMPELASIAVRCLDWIVNAEAAHFPAELLDDIALVLTGGTLLT
jgi:hypothetical protein